MDFVVSRLRFLFGKSHGDLKTDDFITLPHCVLDKIVLELDLPTKAMLSRTCRLMRHLLRADCASAVRRLSAEQYVEYLTGLAAAVRDYYLCGHCNMLHPIDLCDIPDGRYKTRARSPCKSGLGKPRPEFGGDYRLEFHHVDLAIKLSRGRQGGRGSRRTYLRDLTRTYRLSQQRGLPLSVTFTARPSIVSGRFILFRSWEYEEKDRPINLETIKFLSICPHLTVSSYDNRKLRTNPLYAAIVDPPKKELETRSLTLDSCSRCPTDYSVDFSPGRLHVCAWQDFGGGNSSERRLSWQVFVPSIKNNEFRGPTVPHIPGSIRQYYIGAGAQVEYLGSEYTDTVESSKMADLRIRLNSRTRRRARMKEAREVDT